LPVFVKPDSLMEYKILTDSDLLEYLKRGDAAAFQEIYSRHWRNLLLMARQKLPSGDNPEDLVQSLFVRLWEQREKLGVDNLGGYLYASLRNTIINQFRSRMIQEKYTLHAQVLASPYTQNTEEEVELNDLMALLERQLETLPEKTRKIFTLNRLEYKSVREISAMIGIPERTVEYHISHAIKQLRPVLKDYLLCLLLFAIYWG